jgi:GNAT superfamily N-acetyltransferase
MPLLSVMDPGPYGVRARRRRRRDRGAYGAAVGTTCRPATDDDVPAIRDLRRRWWEEDGGAGAVADPDYGREFAAWWDAEREHRRHWVAEVDGAVVAMASIVTMRRMPAPGGGARPWGYVHHVYVEPAHRGVGVGAALLAAPIDACRADGFEHLLLHTRDRSRSFYERLGFAPAGRFMLLPL